MDVSVTNSSKIFTFFKASSKIILTKWKSTHFFWNRTIGSFSKSVMSSWAPFSLTAGCLRHKSQPTCEKKKPGLERERESGWIKRSSFSFEHPGKALDLPVLDEFGQWQRSTRPWEAGLCPDELFTSGRIVRVRVGFAVFMMDTMITRPLVDIVLIRQMEKRKQS